MTERCENCGNELSQCGEFNIGGEPTLDCKVCRQSYKIRILEGEVYQRDLAILKAVKLIAEDYGIEYVDSAIETIESKLANYND